MTGEEIGLALQALQSRDPEERGDALADLSRVDQAEVTNAVFLRLEEAAAALTHGSDASDATFVSQLLDTAAHFGDARAVPVAMSLMSKRLPRNDHQIETNGLDALVKLRAVEAVPFLGEKLFDKKFSEHLEDEVALAIASLGGPQAEAILVRAVAEKRPSVAIAAAKALSSMRGPEVRAALEAAAKARNPELSSAARLSLVAVADDPAAALRALLLLPAGPPGAESDVLYGLRALGRPQLSAILIEVLDTERWRGWSQHIFELLVDQRVAAAAAPLQRSYDDPSSTPWARATAAAYLVQLEPARIELLDFLFTVAQSEEMRVASAGVHPNEFDSAGLVGEALTEGLRAADPVRFVRWLQLLDGWRRLEEKRTQLQHLAGDLVEKVTGSRMYRDFEPWISAYRSQHGA